MIPPDSPGAGRYTSAGHSDLQLELPGRWAPGWHLLSVTGIDGEAGRDLVLAVQVGATPSDRLELALPSFVNGAMEQVFHFDRPVRSARLTAGCGLGTAASGELRPIGRLGLLARACRMDLRQVLIALRWRISGKKIRSRNILMRLFGLPRQMAYQAWLQRNEPAWRQEVTRLHAEAADSAQPTLCVLIHSCRHEAASPETMASLGAQVRKPDRQVIVRNGDGLAAALRTCPDPWIVILADGQALAADALLRIAALATSEPAAITWDSDCLTADGSRCAPELKPQWNEALFLARDYAGAFAVSRHAVEEGLSRLPTLPLALADALLLAAANARRGPVRHIPRILSHRPSWRSREAGQTEIRRALVEAYVRTDSPNASAELADGGSIRVRFAARDPNPLVSLIVPTRDRTDLLAPCIEGLLNRTAYAPVEVLIADNGSTQSRTRRYLADISRDARVRIVDCPGPFNFSEINNKAAAAARGDVLGFINNDIEVLGAGWLDEMVGHALRPRIGAVGARLLYASGLVQHAGVILGVGGYAGHAHRFARPDDAGYLSRLQCQQHCSAVTAACLVVERSKFEAVGGFDARAFPVAYNDVDLCLRLRAAGYMTFWTPFAELLHKESASRQRDYAPERKAAYESECRAFVARWCDLIADDPCYHPALSRRLENFSLE